MSGINQIGQNSAEEFFETIIYMTAYDTARQEIAKLTKDISNPVLKEALDGAMNVLVFGIVFKVIQAQENLVSTIFDIASSLVTILLLNPKNRIISKLRGVRGIKAIKRFGIFGDTMQERTQTALVVSDMVGNHIRGNGVSNSAPVSRTSTLSMINDQKNTLYNRESLHMNFGNNMASRYNETLLFKLLTKSFTPEDETLIKKILGRQAGSALDMDDLNKVADFMYSTDSQGNPIGLSEAFMDLINGLGYVHNKG